MINKQIYLLSIGPVQSFIAQARKTQDLYAGSRLLGDLCKTAIIEAKRQGIIVVSPFLPSTSFNGAIPNRVLGLMQEMKTDEELDRIGRDIKGKIVERFEEIANNSITSGLFKPNNFDEQIASHLDLHWAFFPINDDYTNDYIQAEQQFGAIKNFRPFSQLIEKGRKCSLDGERNVKFYKPNEQERDIQRLLNEKLYQATEQDVFIDKYKSTPLSILQHGEGLSAVSFVKRCYENKSNYSFPSTAHIAMMDTIFKLKNFSDLRGLQLVLDYKAFFGSDFDYQLFFEENINTKYFENNGFKSYIPNLNNIKVTQETLQKHIRNKKLKMLKYYGLVVFDGDNMGKIMSGMHLVNKDRLIEFQGFVSKTLFHYASWAKTYLDCPKGKSVYAGGDDFLGFVNLNCLYTVLEELRNQFRIDVEGKIKDEFTTDLDTDFTFTFSAGVAIAHYKTPLSIVLAKAREMEKLAKKKTDKDALAIAALKHSGESHNTCLKWHQLPYLKTIHEQLSENFSNTFIDALQRSFLKLGKDGIEAKDDFFQQNEGVDIVEKEIKRLTKNSFKNKDLEPSEQIKAKKDMVEAVKETFFSMDTFNDFAQTLNLAEFTQRITL